MSDFEEPVNSLLLPGNYVSDGIYITVALINATCEKGCAGSSEGSLNTKVSWSNGIERHYVFAYQSMIHVTAYLKWHMYEIAMYFAKNYTIDYCRGGARKLI